MYSQKNGLANKNTLIGEVPLQRSGYNLVILIMCSSAPKFKKLEKAIKHTWGSVLHPEVKLIFYTDNQRTFFRKKVPILKGDDLILPCKDGYLNCTEKTLQAFEFVFANFNFNYVFRTNLGSYVNLGKINAFLSKMPLNDFYSGIIGAYQMGNKTIAYASGSGYFLSKNLIELILSERNAFNHQLIDDVALGAFLADHNIEINQLAKRLSYTDDEVEYQMGAQSVEYIEDDQVYHVRLRSANRNLDIKRMQGLFNSKF